MSRKNKVTRRERRQERKRRKKSGRILWIIFILLILAIIYFTDFFGLYDFPGNGFGDGYESLFKDDGNQGTEGTTGSDATSNEQLNTTSGGTEDKQNGEANTTPSNNEQTQTTENTNPSNTSDASTTPGAENTNSTGENTQTGTEETTETVSVTKEYTIYVKGSIYSIDEKEVSISDIEALVSEENVKYKVTLRSIGASSNAWDTVRKALSKDNVEILTEN